MSVALNTAPPDPKLAQRKPSLTINTSIEASTASLLISTAPVIIHVFRAAPSFAATMSGKTSQNRHQQGTRSSSVPFKVRWQSGKLIQNTKEQVTMHVDCPAKQVDTVLDAALLHAQGQLLEQVLSFVEQREGVKLARRAAEVRPDCSMLHC